LGISIASESARRILVTVYRIGTQEGPRRPLAVKQLDRSFAPLRPLRTDEWFAFALG